MMLWIILSAIVALGHALPDSHDTFRTVQHVKRQSSPTGLTEQYPAHNFTIPIDHFHNESRYEPHTNDTFINQYWLDTSNYVEGGPVIVNAMGEDSASFDLVWLQKGLLQQIANATGGVAVLWAQRYYPGGMFVTDYTTENLRFHSTQQAIADLAYFSKRVTFPGLEHRNLTAPGTPWIIIGGSYAGVISAFTRIQYPDLFMGGITSSGITTGIDDFWQFYDVVRRYGAPDCIEMQQKFTKIADTILSSANESAIAQLKTLFRAQSLSNEGFAGMLASPMSTWQGRSWVYNTLNYFDEPGSFCSNFTSNTTLFPETTNFTSDARDIIANGGYANESSSLLAPVLNWIGSVSNAYVGCKPLASCFESSQPSPFNYLQCTEGGLFATGYTPGDPGRPSALPVASRLITAKAAIDQCRKVYNFSSSYTGPDLSRINKYGGLNLTYPQLTISAGEWDIYRPAGPLAEFLVWDEPNPRVKSNGTESKPLIIMKQGGHEWDLSSVFPNETNATFPPQTVKNAQHREIMAVQAWLKEWKNNTKH